MKYVFNVLRFFEKVFFGTVVTFIILPLVMLVLCTAEFLRAMFKPGFVKKYLFSCTFVIVTLFLSFVKAPSDPTYNNIGLDKLVCMLFYLLMTSTFWIEYLRYHKMSEIDYNWVWIPCIAAPILMSIGIEAIQQFLIPSRNGEWMDVIFNSVGIFISAVFWSVVYARKKKIKVITQVRRYDY